MTNRLNSILKSLGLPNDAFVSGELDVHSPIDGALLGKVILDTEKTLSNSISKADQAFKQWRMVPAPKRGELVRLFADELRKNKEALGSLVTLECGKIYQEGLGEVQEMIDICDFAVGLSRQLYGLTMPSERPGHKMAEYWHPLGIVGIISAFNFPVAVWAWNAALALICGNSIVWKPSEKTPLTALACQSLFHRAIDRFEGASEDLLHVVIGDSDMGKLLADDPRVPLISATGSTRMGKELAPQVAKRFGRSILELGGNNAMIVTPSADLELTLRAILFSAVGTAGQRCTSLRRLIVQQRIYNDLLSRLRSAYKQIRVGDPFDETVHIGPLIDKKAFATMQTVLAQLSENGDKVYGGEQVQIDGHRSGYYVHPAIVEVKPDNGLVRTETFAPILYMMSYDNLKQAMTIHNDVPQGLSSCMFTQNLQEAETFLSAQGSDCGIANINIGPSGAEIGGAFGGEKETGGGRESGSDAWKAYMRRSTVTINYSKELPLAQGIEFDIE